MVKKRKKIPITTRPKRRTLGFGAYIQTAKKKRIGDRKVTYTIWECDRGIIIPAQTTVWHDDDTETKPNLSPKVVGEIPPWEDDNTYIFY